MDFITSKSTTRREYPSFSHIASLALRVASLKHEHSSTRRISQDLRSRKPSKSRGVRLPARTSTLSRDNPPLRTRDVSPTLPRRTSDASAIPETPQRLGRSDKDRTSSADPQALTDATSNLFLDAAVLSETNISQNQTTESDTSEQLLQPDISGASQIDDDIRRRSSLDNMVGLQSIRVCFIDLRGLVVAQLESRRRFCNPSPDECKSDIRSRERSKSGVG